MRRTLVSLWIALLGLLIAFPAAAQQEALRLSLHRDFGFAAGGKIQGAFTVAADGPADLVRVEFMIDGLSMGVATGAPFRASFNTGSYALGRHVLSAVGTTAEGSALQAGAQTVEFVSAEEAWKAGAAIVLPLIGIALLVVIASAGLPLLLGRNKPFRLGEYGAAGGAVCGRCGLPFSRHALAPNLFLGKLERCPHCGRWAITRAAGPAQLAAAEARFNEDSHRGQLTSAEEDHVRRLADESRFED